MRYDECVIDGVLCYRRDPYSKWVAYPIISVESKSTIANKPIQLDLFN
jgi:hypothetical protein